MTSSRPATSDISCRLPLLILFISAAIWLVIGSCFGLIGSIKFHGPNFLSSSAWLTYGRVRPAYMNCMLYGFCVQAGLGVLIWMMTRLGRTVLAQRWLVATGAKLWNLGVTVGIIGILAGDNTGFEPLEIPSYAALIMFLGYLLIAVWTLVTFHRRTVPSLAPSQWFLLTALFWFPWIYSTAYLLLVTFPVRGVAQAVIAWWYSANLQTVWFSLVGLGIAFYFIPKLRGRPLSSYYLALFTFWMLILFGSWVGIPNNAPVPAWIPALSTVATGMLIIPIITVAMNIFGTPASAGPVGVPASAGSGSSDQVQPAIAQVSLRFILLGVIAWLLGIFLSIVNALTPITNLTWFVTAQSHLQSYGFFAMVLFGAIYYIVPQLVGLQFKSPTLIRLNFWLAVGGIFLLWFPLALAGVVQGMQLNGGQVAFTSITKTSLNFLRITTIGDLLLLASHIVLLVNVLCLATQFWRTRATVAIAAVTAEIEPVPL